MKNGSESVVHGSVVDPDHARVEYPPKSTVLTLLALLFGEWRDKVTAQVDATRLAAAAALPLLAPARSPARIPVTTRPTQYKE